MRVVHVAVAFVLSGLAFCGCGTDYAWRSSVPEDMRTVSVPTFRNESNVQEAGAVATRQVLREFQREGTFAIRTTDDAALQVQGVVKTVGSGLVGYDRRRGLRLGGQDAVATAVVSIVDKRRGKVLVDNRGYRATATFAAGQDSTTAQRDALGRLMEDLARQIVDDVRALDL
ncbi:MAG: hypothetical protein IJQ65_10415 [Kiritimatiellae bacterium]|nr:hypothetical protein [Kiritimatiellia bacterium]